MWQSPAVPRTGRDHGRAAFTLIEVLVVVAIIALLISILVPSLRKARDQARRAACTNNMHQQLLAMRSYAVDNNGGAPHRAWFSSTVSEASQEAYGSGGNRKVVTNLAMLVGKHVGKNWDVIYCPGTITQFKGSRAGYPPDDLMLDENSGGARFTHGNYNYALPMAGRTAGSPKLDLEVYPRVKGKLDNRWREILVEKSQAMGIPLLPDDRPKDRSPDLVRLMPRRIQVIVMDFIAGGGSNTHKGGINVGYSDGHAKFQRVAESNDDQWGVDNLRANRLWYHFTVNP